MNAVLWLLPGLLLAQPEPAPAVLAAPIVAVEAGVGAETAAPSADAASIFARPLFLDRHALSFVQGSGPGRFNLIDWASRPNFDRLWWLGRWSSSDAVHLHTGIGFNVHWWAGPVSQGVDPVSDLPPQVFDLYLDWAWEQRWTDRLSTQVRFRPGLYTDFRTTPPDAFRIPGEAVGVLQAGRDVYLVGGVQHVQRNNVRWLPVGGVLWQPAPDWELGLVFPEPKIAVALSSRHHLWGYVAAEYGGGRWTYKDENGRSERVESSDYRLAAGIEWREHCLHNVRMLKAKATGFLEIGYVFERHLLFTGPAPRFEPDPAWMIRLGHSW